MNAATGQTAMEQHFSASWGLSGSHGDRLMLQIETPPAQTMPAIA
ncbi:hypothetical protein [Synechococcus elongatus]|nr:hypothetical protein [Synechococcus elongatus]WKW04430.1 hypothetical protein QY054_07460 [Synechococcus elongatus PCC 7942 = FACHB-805]